MEVALFNCSDMLCYFDNMETCTDMMGIQRLRDWVDHQREENEQNCC